MRLAETIKLRKKYEREAAKLAAKYVKDRNYDQAAVFYRSAAFHQAIWKHLAAREQSR